MSRVATQEPIVALTFDDGPHPVYTPQLLDVLAKYDARATFFMVGEQAKAHPDVVQRVAAARHTIGNHTYDHPSFPLIGARERRQQLRACAAAVAPLGSRLFRPPYGHESLASHVSALVSGYDVVGWSAHASDWEQRASQWMLERLLDQIEPGRIVLLHDAIYTPQSPEIADRSEMIAAVEMLLEALSPRYRFVTVPTLLTHGRAIRTWYRPPDRAALAMLPNYDRYAPPRRGPPSAPE
ncbi:MAG: polysaccharide deacetylase family protein [Trueperaceae bacterium]|nr:polysaccharide deacetylase family protein [Trueperaceae bacterium]